jgi:hypothetical protein
MKNTQQQFVEGIVAMVKVRPHMAYLYEPMQKFMRAKSDQYWAITEIHIIEDHFQNFCEELD